MPTAGRQDEEAEGEARRPDAGGGGGGGALDALLVFFGGLSSFAESHSL